MRTHRAAPLDIDGHITIKRRPEKKGKNKGIKTKKNIPIRETAQALLSKCRGEMI
jgi:hypothetical protein